MTKKNKEKQSFITRWPLQKVVILGIILWVSSIISIFFIDQALTLWVHGAFEGRLDPAAKIITWFGQGDTYFFISVIGYFLARLFSERLTHLSWARRWSQARHHFSLMFFCFLVSGLLVLFLKILFGRCRPYHSPDFFPINFKPINFDWNYQSYPSGHTQVGFTLASVLSILYPRWTKWYFIFAAIVGFSRVVLERHYLGDVLAGAYIGILGTYLAWQWRGKKIATSFRNDS